MKTLVAIGRYALAFLLTLALFGVGVYVGAHSTHDWAGLLADVLMTVIFWLIAGGLRYAVHQWRKEVAS